MKYIAKKPKKITLFQELELRNQAWVIISSAPVRNQWSIDLPFKNSLFFFALEDGNYLILDEGDKTSIVSAEEILYISSRVEQNNPIDYSIIVFPEHNRVVELPCLSSYSKTFYKLPKTITDYAYSQGFTRD